MLIPKIYFYLINTDLTSRKRELFLCYVVEKAYSLGNNVYIFTKSDEETKQIDDLLWTFRQDSFIPHECYSTFNKDISPVLIGNILPIEVSTKVLINYTKSIPEYLDRYEVIVELVDQQQDILNGARIRFRQYCKFGLNPKIYRIDKNKLNKF